MLCNQITNFDNLSTVSRHIKDRRHFNIDKNIIKTDAFIYPKNDKALSLVCIDGLSEEEIWDIGDNEVFKNVDKSSKEKFKTIARADIQVLKLKKLHIDGFKIECDNDGFKRHVTALSSLEKHFFAKILAFNSNLKIR